MDSMTENEIYDLIDMVKDYFVENSLKNNAYADASNFGIEMFASTLKTAISCRTLKEEVK